jgi:predicted RNase H-like HicB family nuclease
MSAAKDRFDGYGVTLFQDDDGDYLAYLTELPNISAYSHTPEWALDELATAWKLVKEEFAVEGKPVRVPPLRRK